MNPKQPKLAPTSPVNTLVSSGTPPLSWAADVADAAILKADAQLVIAGRCAMQPSPLIPTNLALATAQPQA